MQSNSTQLDRLVLENQLCFKLYALSRQVTGLYAPLLEEMGVTYPQYLVLLVLWEGHDVTVKAIGERLFLDSGTLTPLLKRLEAKQLLTRRRDPADERSVIIQLTANGKSLKKMAECLPEELNKTLALDKTAYDKIKSALDQLLRQLK